MALNWFRSVPSRLQQRGLQGLAADQGEIDAEEARRKEEEERQRQLEAIREAYDEATSTPLQEATQTSFRDDILGQARERFEELTGGVGQAASQAGQAFSALGAQAEDTVQDVAQRHEQGRNVIGQGVREGLDAIRGQYDQATSGIGRAAGALGENVKGNYGAGDRWLAQPGGAQDILSGRKPVESVIDFDKVERENRQRLGLGAAAGASEEEAAKYGPRPEGPGWDVAREAVQAPTIGGVSAADIVTGIPRAGRQLARSIDDIRGGAAALTDEEKDLGQRATGALGAGVGVLGATIGAVGTLAGGPVGAAAEEAARPLGREIARGAREVGEAATEFVAPGGGLSEVARLRGARGPLGAVGRAADRLHTAPSGVRVGEAAEEAGRLRTAASAVGLPVGTAGGAAFGVKTARERAEAEGRAPTLGEQLAGGTAGAIRGADIGTMPGDVADLGVGATRLPRRVLERSGDITPEMGLGEGLRGAATSRLAQAGAGVRGLTEDLTGALAEQGRRPATAFGAKAPTPETPDTPEVTALRQQMQEANRLKGEAARTLGQARVKLGPPEKPPAGLTPELQPVWDQYAEASLRARDLQVEMTRLKQAAAPPRQPDTLESPLGGTGLPPVNVPRGGRGSFQEPAITYGRGEQGMTWAPQGDLVNGAQAPFYSALQRAVQQLPAGRLSPAQLTKHLLSQPEVKQQQLVWSGLDDYLTAKIRAGEGRGESVTKEELGTWLQEHDVRVYEVQKGQAGGDPQEVARLEAEQPVLLQAAERAQDTLAEVEQVGEGEAFQILGQIQDRLMREQGVPETGFSDPGQLAAQALWGYPNLPKDVPFFQALEQEGDYLDPVFAAADGSERYNLEQLRQRWQDADQAQRDAWEVMHQNETALEASRGQTLPGGPAKWVDYQGTENLNLPGASEPQANAREFLLTLGPRTDMPDYAPPHWDEPNVIAHIRMTDRVTPNGERVLLIEELQSDWHQEARDVVKDDRGQPIIDPTTGAKQRVGYYPGKRTPEEIRAAPEFGQWQGLRQTSQDARSAFDEYERTGEMQGAQRAFREAHTAALDRSLEEARRAGIPEELLPVLSPSGSLERPYRPDDPQRGFYGTRVSMPTVLVRYVPAEGTEVPQGWPVYGSAPNWGTVEIVDWAPHPNRQEAQGLERLHEMQAAGKRFQEQERLEAAAGDGQPNVVYSTRALDTALYDVANTDPVFRPAKAEYERVEAENARLAQARNESQNALSELTNRQPEFKTIETQERIEALQHEIMTLEEGIANPRPGPTGDPGRRREAFDYASSHMRDYVRRSGDAVPENWWPQHPEFRKAIEQYLGEIGATEVEPLPERGFEDWKSGNDQRRLREAQRELQSLERELTYEQGRHQTGGRPPAGPFQKEGWQTLGLKRMLHLAATGGYDFLGLTPGDVHAFRYDPFRGMGVEALEYHPESQNLKVDMGARGGLEEHANVAPNDLHRYVGNAVAQALLDPQQLARGNGVAVIRAADWEGGLSRENEAGVGLRRSYDEILPGMLADLGRRFGAEVRVAPETDPNRALATGRTDSGVLLYPERPLDETITERAESGESRQRPNFQPAHLLEVTPEMAQAMQTPTTEGGGLPLFMRQQAGQAARRPVGDLEYPGPEQERQGQLPFSGRMPGEVAQAGAQGLGALGRRAAEEAAAPGPIARTGHEEITAGGRPLVQDPGNGDAPFFSALERALDNPKLPETMKPAWLSGQLRGLGVTAEEIRWTGLDDFLADKLKANERVTKQGVKDYLAANRVEVTEVALGTDPAAVQRFGDAGAELAEAMQQRTDAVREIQQGFAEALVAEGFYDPPGKYSTEAIAKGKRKGLEFGGSPLGTRPLGGRRGPEQDAWMNLRSQAAEHITAARQRDDETIRRGHERVFGFDPGQGGTPQARLRQEGGYERLVQLADEWERREAEARVSTIQRVEDAERNLDAAKEAIHGGPPADPQRSEIFMEQPRWPGYSSAGLDDEAVVAKGAQSGYREFVLLVPPGSRAGQQMGAGYTHGHWQGLKNPLVHVRATVRSLPDGRRVLYLEEVQSDLHQASREEVRDPNTGEKLTDAEGKVIRQGYREPAIALSGPDDPRAQARRPLHDAYHAAADAVRQNKAEREEFQLGTQPEGVGVMPGATRSMEHDRLLREVRNGDLDERSDPARWARFEELDAEWQRIDRAYSMGQMDKRAAMENIVGAGREPTPLADLEISIALQRQRVAEAQGAYQHYRDLALDEDLAGPSARDARTAAVAQRQAASEAYREEQNFLRHLEGQKDRHPQSKSPPRAPFEETSAWMTLALKRMLRVVADEGLDGLALTTGETAAKRVGAAQQIQEISWQPYTGETTILDTDGQTHHLRFNEARLREHVGDEIAQRLIDKANDDNDRYEERLTTEEQQQADAFLAQARDEWLQDNPGRTAEDWEDSNDYQNAVDRFEPDTGHIEPVRGELNNEEIGEASWAGNVGMMKWYDADVRNTAIKLGKKFGATVEQSTVETPGSKLADVTTGTEPVTVIGLPESGRAQIREQGLPLFLKRQQQMGRDGTVGTDGTFAPNRVFDRAGTTLGAATGAVRGYQEAEEEDREKRARGEAGVSPFMKAAQALFGGVKGGVIGKALVRSGRFARVANQPGATRGRALLDFLQGVPAGEQLAGRLTGMEGDLGAVQHRDYVEEWLRLPQGDAGRLGERARIAERELDDVTRQQLAFQRRVDSGSATKAEVARAEHLKGNVAKQQERVDALRARADSARATTDEATARLEAAGATRKLNALPTKGTHGQPITHDQLNAALLRYKIGGQSATVAAQEQGIRPADLNNLIDDLGLRHTKQQGGAILAERNEPAAVKAKGAGAAAAETTGEAPEELAVRANTAEERRREAAGADWHKTLTKQETAALRAQGQEILDAEYERRGLTPTGRAPKAKEPFHYVDLDGTSQYADSTYEAVFFRLLDELKEKGVVAYWHKGLVGDGAFAMNEAMLEKWRGLPILTKENIRATFAPDFFIVTKDPDTGQFHMEVIEVKNTGIYARPEWRVPEKLAQGQEFLEANGIGFRIFTGDQIGRSLLASLRDQDLAPRADGRMGLKDPEARARLLKTLATDFGSIPQELPGTAPRIRLGEWKNQTVPQPGAPPSPMDIRESRYAPALEPVEEPLFPGQTAVPSFSERLNERPGQTVHEILAEFNRRSLGPKLVPDASEALAEKLPQARQIVAALKAIPTVTNTSKGLSFDLRQGKTTKDPTYQRPPTGPGGRRIFVSVFPHAEVRFPGTDVHEVALAAWLSEHRQILQNNPDVRVGLWYDNEKGPNGEKPTRKTYLDISILVDDGAEAEALGRSMAQKSLYDEDADDYIGMDYGEAGAPRPPGKDEASDAYGAYLERRAAGERGEAGAGGEPGPAGIPGGAVGADRPARAGDPGGRGLPAVPGEGQLPGAAAAAAARSGDAGASGGPGRPGDREGLAGPAAGVGSDGAPGRLPGAGESREPAPYRGRGVGGLPPEPSGRLLTGIAAGRAGRAAADLGDVYRQEAGRFGLPTDRLDAASAALGGVAGAASEAALEPGEEETPEDRLKRILGAGATGAVAGMTARRQGARAANVLRNLPEARRLAGDETGALNLGAVAGTAGTTPRAPRAPKTTPDYAAVKQRLLDAEARGASPEEIAAIEAEAETADVGERSVGETAASAYKLGMLLTVRGITRQIQGGLAVGAWQPAERLLAGALASLPEAMGGSRSAEAPSVGEGTRMLQATFNKANLAQAAAEAWASAAGRTTATAGAAAEAMAESGGKRAGTGLKGAINRKVDRGFQIFSVADTFFRRLATNAEMQATAYRLAKAGEGNGADLEARIADLVANDERVHEAGAAAGKYRTLQQDLDQYGKRVDEVRKLPGGWLVMPFWKTPFNAAKYDLERSPVGLIKSGLQAATGGNAKVNETEKYERFARGILGSVAAMGLVSLALNDNLTGPEPRDQAERDAWRAEGRQPYSVRIGGRWVPVNQVPGMNATLTQVMGVHDYIDRRVRAGTFNPADWKTYDGIGTALAVSTADNLLRRPFFDTLQELLEAVQEGTGTTGDEEDAPSIMAGMGEVGRTFIPGIVREAERVTGTVDRAPRNLPEEIAAGIPGLSRLVPERRDPFGRPVTRTGSGSGNPVREIIGGAERWVNPSLGTAERPGVRRYVGTKSIEEDAAVAAVARRLKAYQDDPARVPRPSDEDLKLLGRHGITSTGQYSETRRIARERAKMVGSGQTPLPAYDQALAALNPKPKGGGGRVSPVARLLLR